VLVIDVNDPKAAHINNADDLEKAYPGTVNKTFTFLRDYKVRDCSSFFAFSDFESRFRRARDPTTLRLRGS
jgi:inorganic pyrophosphatase